VVQILHKDFSINTVKEEIIDTTAGATTYRIDQHPNMLAAEFMKEKTT